MSKPTTREGYSDERTIACERVLVTLLRGLGPCKKSVFLVGGLTPRYIVRANPPDVPPHAGTQDVDAVIDLQILVDTDAYSTLEANLRKLNFERAENEKGQKLTWRWQTRTDRNALIRCRRTSHVGHRRRVNFNREGEGTTVSRGSAAEGATELPLIYTTTCRKKFAI